MEGMLPWMLHHLMLLWVRVFRVLAALLRVGLLLDACIVSLDLAGFLNH
jgi:hypothetical protein